jgi:hypothetical protein
MSGGKDAITPRFERRGKAAEVRPDSLPSLRFPRRGGSKAGHVPEQPRPAGPEARRGTPR